MNKIRKIIQNGTDFDCEALNNIDLFNYYILKKNIF